MDSGRTRDPEATRASILEAAEATFVEKGFADTSMSEIADAAGVTKSLIHHHFGSKAKLWEEVKHHRFGDYAAAQRPLLESSEPDARLLYESVIAYFRFLQKNPGFSRLLSWTHLEEAEEQAVNIDDQLMHLGVQCISEGQERGNLRDDVHPFHMLVSFIGLAQSWFQSKDHHCQWCEDDSPLQDDEQYLDSLLKVFFEGVLPRPDGAATLDSLQRETSRNTPEDGER